MIFHDLTFSMYIDISLLFQSHPRTLFYVYCPRINSRPPARTVMNPIFFSCMKPCFFSFHECGIFYSLSFFFYNLRRVSFLFFSLFLSWYIINFTRRLSSPSELLSLIWIAKLVTLINYATLLFYHKPVWKKFILKNQWWEWVDLSILHFAKEKVTILLMWRWFPKNSFQNKKFEKEL